MESALMDIFMKTLLQKKIILFFHIHFTGNGRKKQSPEGGRNAGVSECFTRFERMFFHLKSNHGLTGRFKLYIQFMNS